MRQFTADKLARLQSTQEASMQDTCIILNSSTTEDDYNLPVETWNWNNGTESICGYKPTTKEEGQIDSQIVKSLCLMLSYAYLLAVIVSSHRQHASRLQSGLALLCQHSRYIR